MNVLNSCKIKTALRAAVNRRFHTHGLRMYVRITCTRTPMTTTRVYYRYTKTRTHVLQWFKTDETYTSLQVLDCSVLQRWYNIAINATDQDRRTRLRTEGTRCACVGCRRFMRRADRPGETRTNKTVSSGFRRFSCLLFSNFITRTTRDFAQTICTIVLAYR